MIEKPKAEGRYVVMWLNLDLGAWEIEDQSDNWQDLEVAFLSHTDEECPMFLMRLGVGLRLRDAEGLELPN